MAATVADDGGAPAVTTTTSAGKPYGCFYSGGYYMLKVRVYCFLIDIQQHCVTCRPTVMLPTLLVLPPISACVMQVTSRMQRSVVRHSSARTCEENTPACIHPHTRPHTHTRAHTPAHYTYTHTPAHIHPHAPGTYTPVAVTTGLNCEASGKISEPDLYACYAMAMFLSGYRGSVPSSLGSKPSYCSGSGNYAYVPLSY